MRRGTRNIDLMQADLHYPSTSWAWQSSELASQGVRHSLWIVLSGSLLAETADDKWIVGSEHVLHISAQGAPMTLMSLPKVDCKAVMLNYHESNPGPSLPIHCSRTPDQVFSATLAEKILQRWRLHQVWEANSLLDVLLDEVMHGEQIQSHKRSDSAQAIAQQFTQTKLKCIDWSQTQRLKYLKKIQ